MCKSLELINQGGEIRVSSRVIALDFQKNHYHITPIIESLTHENSMVKKMFVESKYNHKGNEYKEYFMNRDGYSLLVMGFTGEKALEWKLKYIEAFNKMEKELKEPKQLTAMEQLKLQYEVLNDHDSRLKNLEDTMTIDYEQQLTIFNVAKSNVLGIVGGKGSLSYKEMYKKVISAIWRDYKGYFAINSYKNTARKDFEKAKDYLVNWKPEGSLLRELEAFIK